MSNKDNGRSIIAIKWIYDSKNITAQSLVPRIVKNQNQKSWKWKKASIYLFFTTGMATYLNRKISIIFCLS